MDSDRFERVRGPNVDGRFSPTWRVERVTADSGRFWDAFDFEKPTQTPSRRDADPASKEVRSHIGSAADIGGNSASIPRRPNEPVQ